MPFVIAKLSGVVLMLGLVLFVVWAARDLKKKQLKKLVTWLLVVGIVGTVGGHLLFGADYKDGWHGKWKHRGGEVAVSEEVVEEVVAE
jgi:hypothetical protein